MSRCWRGAIRTIACLRSCWTARNRFRRRLPRLREMGGADRAVHKKARRNSSFLFEEKLMRTFICMVAVFAGWAAIAQQKQAPPKGAINDAILRGAASDAKEWVTYGGDYAETRYSVLKQIDVTNVQRLGLTRVWPTEAL